MIAQLLNRPTPAAQQTAGYWRTVRLCVDLAAQEWLNVGVTFQGMDGSRQSRLIHNLAGIRCLYDADTVESARFLLDQAESALENAARIPDGWNIALGPEKFVQGTSANAIVESLFHRMVPLARHQQADRTDHEEHPHATMNVRKTVRQLLNRHLSLAQGATPDFWRRAPMPVSRDGTDIQMDVQIVATARNLYLHGAVASAWYKTRYHRNASLSQAVNAMTTACQAFPQSHNVLYLLKPPAGARTLSDTDHRAIAQDIETSQWLLQQQNATLKVAQSESEMVRAILQDLEMLPELV